MCNVQVIKPNIHSLHACMCLERETVFYSQMMDPWGLFFTLKSFCEDVKHSATAFMTFKLHYDISFSTDNSSIITPYLFIFAFANFTFPLVLTLLNSLNFSPSVPGLVWFNDYNNIPESCFLCSRRTHS